jgi:hypothetical protein
MVAVLSGADLSIPSDQAILGMVSESPGRNVSEPIGGLDRKRSGGRVFSFETKAARIDES